MGHYAKIENDIVTEVIVAKEDFVSTLDGEWVKTSYNTRGGVHLAGKEPLRGNFAGVGFVYNRIKDVFYRPQPFPSWTLNKTIWDWQPPKPYPDDGELYYWDEPTTSWKISE